MAEWAHDAEYGSAIRSALDIEIHRDGLHGTTVTKDTLEMGS